MNKTNIELRKVIIRMFKSDKTTAEISAVTGVKARTITNYRKIFTEQYGEAKILSNPPFYSQKPSVDLNELKKYIETHPFAYLKEIAQEFNVKKSTIHKWRQKLGFKRKRAKTTYREADPELKKTLKKN